MGVGRGKILSCKLFWLTVIKKLYVKKISNCSHESLMCFHSLSNFLARPSFLALNKQGLENMHSIWNPGEWHINSKFAWKWSFVETQTSSHPSCFYHPSPKTYLQNVGVAPVTVWGGVSYRLGLSSLLQKAITGRPRGYEIYKNNHKMGEWKPAQPWAIN